MLIDKILPQETGSFLLLLHMSMVGQISYCGQNSHASGEFLCQLPAPRQIRPKQGWSGGRWRTVWAPTHSHSPLSVWKTEILRCLRTKEDIHRALYGVIFGSYLFIALSEGLTLHPQPQQQSTADMTGRVFLSSSKDTLGMKAWGMEKHLPALQKLLKSGISSDK